MKILITGATGLVGSELTDLLLKNNHEVHYLTTRKETIENKENYKGFLWNVKQMTIDSKCIDGVDAIVHLAGETVFQRWTDAAKKRIMDSRLDSTQLLLNLLDNNDHNVKQVISASAIGIYPDNKNGSAMKENEVPPVADNFLATVCVAWESIALQFKERGFKHAIARLGIVLSDKGGALDQMKKPVQYYAGAGFGDGTMWQSWIAIDDLVAQFQFMLENQLDGVYNAVAPQPVRNRELIESIGKQLDKPVFLPNVPEFIMKLMLGEMSAIVLASQHVSSDKMEKAGLDFKYPTIDKALAHYL